jgi:hypothetical protein
MGAAEVLARGPPVADLAPSLGTTKRQELEDRKRGVPDRPVPVAARAAEVPVGAQRELPGDDTRAVFTAVLGARGRDADRRGEHRRQHHE